MKFKATQQNDEREERQSLIDRVPWLRDADPDSDAGALRECFLDPKVTTVEHVRSFVEKEVAKAKRKAEVSNDLAAVVVREILAKVGTGSNTPELRSNPELDRKMGLYSAEHDAGNAHRHTLSVFPKK